jgi:PAS domain S-box-containing protein
LRKILASATIAALAAVILVRSGALPYLFSAGYLPHRYCYLAQPWLIWLNVTMDGLIAASYVLIFACLFWIAHRLRHAAKIRTFLWVFAAFAIFIVACASTHLMEVVTVWWPVYRLSVAFKMACAAASVTTAVLFVRASPRLIESILHFLEMLSVSQQQIVADAGERVRIEGRVKDSEARLQAVFNSVLDGILTMDARGNILSANAAVENIFGYDAAELTGKNVTVLMAEMPAFSSTGLQRAIGVDKREGRTRTGRVFPVEMTITESLLDGKQSFVGVLRDITERKQAEAALREKEHFLSESQRIAHIGSWTWDLHDLDRRLVWSEELYQMYGVTAETFTPTMDSFYARLFPADRPAMEQWLAACVAGEKPSDLEFRLVMPDGTVKVCNRRGELQYDAEKRPVRVAGTTQDITERKRVENELRDSEERFQAVANGIPQLAWMAEADGSIFWYNQRWYEYTGTTFEQMQRWGWQRVHDPDRLPVVMKEWTAAVRTGTSFEMEFPLRGADGRFRIFLTRVLPLKDTRGQVVRWFGTNTDITERKQAEDRLAAQAEELASSRIALQAQQLMLQSVLDSMVEGLVAADEQGNFILWNRAAKDIIGMGAADISPAEWSAHYGTFLPDMVTPFPIELDPLLRAVKGEFSSAEMFIQNHSLGRGTWIETRGAPLRGNDGKLWGGVIAFRDISQRRADELEIRKLNEELETRIAQRTAQLQTANDELEAFTYSVSHDLRAPLRHIGGFSKILVQDFGAAMVPEAREHLQRIGDAVIRMGHLVDGLLSLAKLGRQSLKVQPTELNAVLEEVIAVLQPECEGRTVEWRIGVLPTVACDRILMAQVFQNLLGNAIKYSRGRSPALIEVGSIQQPEKPAVIFVRDNGAGFNMQYAEKLFGVFQRMHTQTEFEGTGVGLATVQRIIQRHGGTVWAEAEADRGAAFFFTVNVDHEAVNGLKSIAFQI